MHIIPGGFHRLVVFWHFDWRDFRRRLLFFAAQPPGQRQQTHGEEQEDKVRHTWHETKQPQYCGAEHHYARVSKQLANHLLTDIFIVCHAGHNHARCGGNDQCRDLRNQTVTDGQQGITLRRIAHRQAMLQYPHQQAANDVDNHDQNARDGVAAYKLTRTVHGAVEVSFLGHIRTTTFCLIFPDKTGVKVGVDRHLFTRHPIQHKARTDFCDTPRTFGDNHKVDDNEDDEHHDTDGKVTANKEVTKGFNHPTRCGRAGMAFKQNDTG